MLGYVWRDLVRNPRRTVAATLGITLGVGLFSAVLFYADGSGATLTRRAVAPLALDMQLLLTAPAGQTLRFEERIEPTGPLAAGQQAKIVLTLTNASSAPANEVVVNDEPPPPLRYVAESLTIDGAPTPDVGGAIPLSQGVAHIGLNLGSLDAGVTTTLVYEAVADAAVPDTAALKVQGRVSTRENVVPVPANAGAAATLAGMQARARAIPGVMSADGLWFVDLPGGSLHAGSRTLSDPLRVYAFGPDYVRHYPSIQLARGAFDPAAATLSAEAARGVGAEPGGTVAVDLPAGAAPLRLPVSGVADLAQARPLFSSRKAKKFEDFLYVPNVVVVAPEVFERDVVPAFAKAAAAEEGDVVKSLPRAEVDVLVARSELNADPGHALAQTAAVARAVAGLAPDTTELIDNISNALDVARRDAAVARRMLVFLGLPGILLAAFLTAYAGGILAATQRREHALLRLRGAHRGHLVRLLLLQAVGLAAIGSALGVGVGLLSVAAVLGRDALAAAGSAGLATSAAESLAAGAVTTALALAVPGLRSMRREIAHERMEIAASPVPAWRRRRLDLVLIAAAAIAEVVVVTTGALDPPPVVVSEGASASMPSRLLLAPMVAWTGGVLVAVRVLAAAIGRLPVPAPPRFGNLLRGNVIRSLRRRSWAIATGTTGIGLVVALAVGLAMFSATYAGTKRADSRFTVGADVRVASSPLSPRPRTIDDSAELRVPGVAAVSPVVFTLENAVLVARFNQDRKDLAAIDPATFEQTAPLSDAFFLDTTVAEALDAMRRAPDALLVNEASADDLSIRVGDTVQVLLARGTKQQVLRPFRVVALYDRLPGFPDGVDVVANLSAYTGATGLRAADFFLLRTDAGARVADVAAALRSGPGAAEPLIVETTQTALNKDQSSLTALDIRGLVAIDSLFTTLISAAVIGIFVFGLLLHRRREYLTMRALGLRGGELFALVSVEAGLTALCGLVAGVPAGLGMGYLLVHTLRPLFILTPELSVPVVRVAAVALLPVAAAVIAALLATSTLRRLHPTEILRDT